MLLQGLQLIIDHTIDNCFALVPRTVDFHWYRYRILTFWYRDNTTGKNTTNLKRHLKAFHNEIEVSQDINVMLLSILESSCQLTRLWLMCLILTLATGAEND